MTDVTNTMVLSDGAWNVLSLQAAPTVATQEECTRLLTQLEDVDPTLAGALECTVNEAIAESFEAGFMAGWTARQDPTPYIFKPRTQQEATE